MRYFLMCLLLLCCSALQASIDAYEFKSEDQPPLSKANGRVAMP